MKSEIANRPPLSSSPPLSWGFIPLCLAVAATATFPEFFISIDEWNQFARSLLNGKIEHIFSYGVSHNSLPCKKPTFCHSLKSPSQLMFSVAEDQLLFCNHLFFCFQLLIISFPYKNTNRFVIASKYLRAYKAPKQSQYCLALGFTQGFLFSRRRHGDVVIPAKAGIQSPFSVHLPQPLIGD